jgi:hypothetical protein
MKTATSVNVTQLTVLEDSVTLSVRVPASFRKELRLYGLTHEITLSDLIRQSFAAFKQMQAVKGK